MPTMMMLQNHFSRVEAGKVRYDAPLAPSEKYPNTCEARKQPPPIRPTEKLNNWAISKLPRFFKKKYRSRTTEKERTKDPAICVGRSTIVFIKTNLNLVRLKVLFICCCYERNIFLTASGFSTTALKRCSRLI